MVEKAYKTMKSAGAWNIVVGVLLIVFGLTAGVLSIVYGGKLLSHKSEMTF